MKSYQDLISEAIKSPEMGVDSQKYKDWLRLAAKTVAKYSSDPVLWRGFTYMIGGHVKRPGISYIALVTNKKLRKFRGSDYNWKAHEGLDAVVSGISETTPVFCSQDFSKAKFFGTPYVVVPIPQFKTLYSKTIPDLGTITTKRTVTGPGATTATKAEYSHEEIQEMIDSYKVGNNKILKSSGYAEVILDAKRYALIDVGRLININKSKFLKVKSLEQVKTYSDVLHVINNTLSYLDWKDKN